MGENAESKVILRVRALIMKITTISTVEFLNNNNKKKEQRHLLRYSEKKNRIVINYNSANVKTSTGDLNSCSFCDEQAMHESKKVKEKVIRRKHCI